MMNKKILIIEDEEKIANVFKKQLDLKGGFDVEIATGGKQGLTMLEQNQYDLAFLDLVMPEVDGVEVLKTVRNDSAKYKNTPIIALTNVTAADTKQEVEALGAVKFVIKTDTDIEQLVDEFFKI